MSVLHVVFKVDGAEYVLPAADVLQMESFTGATPVPGAAPHVAGLVQVRGRVIPVVDARLRFGLPPVERTLDSRVVVAQLGSRVVGLVVDSAREVLKLDPQQLKPPPPLVVEGARGFVKAVAQVGPRLVMLIDFPRVIGEETLDGDGQR
ncbi:putative chemotaxis protein CheW [Myxococcus xanthus DK 1622]|uniref:Chemotaxis protein CheW n=3 Tax=Myxococcus TaxID=32 RepID=Q1CWZ5_MYXXD|nr:MULTISPECIES: chemotaxis protein CheW [Myxococcus]ABF85986.1 putative chemotaxis protein CheW [Myxococcus xanthus DK 1622]NOJ56227.1 chemotaxis protein CheW [Myxococcus xanthus]QDE71770.1 chemotaxis protein CheW [Myxococcus xanthus]QDE79051.1 chemotaxis protein CheW [Myxococcus xanthus]QDE86428.1 chemotaxis protein CheW [Myxococcus xanthus]